MYMYAEAVIEWMMEKCECVYVCVCVSAVTRLSVITAVR
jgi:hypothetical protein